LFFWGILGLRLGLGLVFDYLGVFGFGLGICFFGVFWVWVLVWVFGLLGFLSLGVGLVFSFVCVFGFGLGICFFGVFWVWILVWVFGLLGFLSLGVGLVFSFVCVFGFGLVFSFVLAKRAARVLLISFRSCCVPVAAAVAGGRASVAELAVAGLDEAQSVRVGGGGDEVELARGEAAGGAQMALLAVRVAQVALEAHLLQVGAPFLAAAAYDYLRKRRKCLVV